MRGSKEQPARFAKVYLDGAKIAGVLNLSGATVEGDLAMAGLQVGQNLVMRAADPDYPSRFLKKVNLDRAQIGGGINLSEAIFEGKLSTDNTHVGTDFTMSRTRRSDLSNGTTASLRLLQVGRTLDLADAVANNLDLSGSRITGELRLVKVAWRGDQKLILRNTHTSVLHYSGSAWPEQVVLDGFTYERLGGIGESSDDETGQASRDDFEWIKKNRPYSPQPYEQLANVLRKMGEPAKAEDVLYGGREKARHAARDKSILRYIGMSLLNSTIGYGLGYRYFWCLKWVAGLVAIGFAVLYLDLNIVPRGYAVPQLGLVTSEIGFSDSLLFSLQKLIPFVQVEKFDQLKLGGFAKRTSSFTRLPAMCLLPLLPPAWVGSRRNLSSRWDDGKSHCLQVRPGVQSLPMLMKVAGVVRSRPRVPFSIALLFQSLETLPLGSAANDDKLVGVVRKNKRPVGRPADASIS